MQHYVLEKIFFLLDVEVSCPSFVVVYVIVPDFCT
jgi:hypothetical protein